MARKKIEVKPGEKYSRLTVISESEKVNYIRYFNCICDCGNKLKVRIYSLVNGNTKSCGCLDRDKLIKRNTKHSMCGTRIYRIWCVMKDRCYNKKTPNYKFYGKKGVSVCKEWLNFKPFYDWALKNNYNEKLTIDRINFKGNYEPDNCRWVTMKTQNRNKSSNRLIKFENETKCLSAWAETIGINETSLSNRIKNWGLKKALTTPKPL